MTLYSPPPRVRTPDSRKSLPIEGSDPQSHWQHVESVLGDGVDAFVVFVHIVPHSPHQLSVQRVGPAH
jgi:hypothetical protein